MTWLASIKKWLNKPRQEADAAACYRTIVTQARQGRFYSQMGVPDTPQGRFELVMIHAALVMARLAGAGQPGFNQALFDLMFADFDVSLRELGVGDLGVGKRVHSWAQAYHGRAVAYNGALRDRIALAEALERNIDLMPDRAIALAAYMQLATMLLHEATVEEITAGHFAWPVLEAREEDDDDRTETTAA